MSIILAQTWLSNIHGYQTNTYIINIALLKIKLCLVHAHISNYGEIFFFFLNAINLSKQPLMEDSFHLLIFQIYSIKSFLIVSILNLVSNNHYWFHNIA